MEVLERLHWVKGLDAVANAFAGTVYTDIVEAKAEGVLFLLHKGVGTTGTSTLTVEACDTVAPGNTTAVAFRYRVNTTGDTWGAWTEATVTGFTTTAGSSQLYQVFVPSSELATEGYGYARLKAVEVAADPVLGGVLIAIVNTRVQPQPVTVII